MLALKMALGTQLLNHPEALTGVGSCCTQPDASHQRSSLDNSLLVVRHRFDPVGGQEIILRVGSSSHGFYQVTLTLHVPVGSDILECHHISVSQLLQVELLYLVSWEALAVNMLDHWNHCLG